MTNLDQLNKQQYINLETFRKSGVGVKTPVWFVRDGDTVYVRTVKHAGKVKRVHNNGRATFAPCKVDGTPLGAWQTATAREVTTDEAYALTDRLLGQKYGLTKRILAVISAMRGSQYTVLEIKPAPEAGT